MDTILRDLRYAARQLLKRPGFTAIAVLALALGIGANTAVFSVVDAVLLEPLPFKEPERLMVLWEQETAVPDRPPEPTSAATFQDWRAQSRTFDELAAWVYSGFALTGAGEPEEIGTVRASANLFRLLGVEPALGRAFLPEEEQPGRHRIVILSHGLWQRRFGGDPGILGRSLTLDGEPYAVVGVMPAGFRFPDDDDVGMWVPLSYLPYELRSRGQRMFNVVGRLAADATLEQAQNEMSTIAGRLAVQYPEAHRGWDVLVQPAREVVIGETRPALLVLLGAVAFVLLIACANVASLLLARAADRQREIAVRSALGASRRRLVRALLVESGLVALLGGAAGLLLAVWGLDLILALAPEGLPRWNVIRIDGDVLAFTTFAAAATALLAGLAPALNASRAAPASALREGSDRTTEGAGGRRLRHAMIVAEVALSIVLLVGAGLLIRSFHRLSNVDPGFDADHLLAAAIFLPDNRYPDDARQIHFFESLLERVRSLPGVTSVGAVTTLPMNPVGIDHDMPFRVPGTPEALADPLPQADFRIASEGYFRTMGIPLLRGRGFTARDRADAPCVIVVNETFVQRFLPPGSDPLRESVVIGDDPGDPACDIIGVVGNVRHRGLDAVPRPEFYVAFRQVYSYGTLTLAVRTTRDPLALAQAVKEQVFALDPALPVAELATMDALVADSVADRRFHLSLLGAFAALAVILAASGIYGVISYTVAQRTREIGIRIALGARRGEVLRAVLGQGARLAALGAAFGLAGALLLTRSLAGMLYEVSPTDPLTFGGVAAVLAAIALLASWLPARRAARVDPMVALRSE
ncbi:MAG TPA: ABC transporter permease [Longimicrobiales bacterium]